MHMQPIYSSPASRADDGECVRGWVRARLSLCARVRRVLTGVPWSLSHATAMTDPLQPILHERLFQGNSLCLEDIYGAPWWRCLTRKNRWELRVRADTAAGTGRVVEGYSWGAGRSRPAAYRVLVGCSSALKFVHCDSVPPNQRGSLWIVSPYPQLNGATELVGCASVRKSTPAPHAPFEGLVGPCRPRSFPNHFPRPAPLCPFESCRIGPGRTNSRAPPRRVLPLSTPVPIGPRAAALRVLF